MPGFFGICTVPTLRSGIFRMLSSIPVIGLVTFAHAAETCLQHPYNSATAEDQNGLLEMYQDVAPALGNFPSLAKALDNAAPELCFSSVMDNALAYFEFDQNRIVISDGLSKGMQNGVFLHELRHLEQFIRGSCPSDDLAMNENSRAIFAMEADASAISFLVAWDMKEKGQDSVWNALSSWPSHTDISERFANEMAESGNVALAVTAAFDQWYASSSRLERYHFAACSDYLDRQDVNHNLPMYQLLPDAFLEDLCILPDGGSYECSYPETERR